MTSFRIEELQRTHSVDAFECGREALNLIRYALQNQQAGASQTYVALAGKEIVDYYTLSVAQVEYTDATERLTKGLARQPVPSRCLLVLQFRPLGKATGLGSGLLKDATLRTLQATEVRAFYEHFDFVPSPVDPYHLFRLLKDIRANL